MGLRGAALRVWWSRRERDLMFEWDKRKVDGNLVCHHLTPLAEELERRGYDITTLSFSIKRAGDGP